MSKSASFVSTFMMHRTVLSELIDALSDSDFTYQPWDGAMTTGELIAHTLTSSYTFTTAAATGEIERPERPTITTAADAKAAFTSWTEKTVAAIQGMDDEQFEKIIDLTNVIGRQLPSGAVLHIMRDHEIHHKGQLFVYARLCGVEKMPRFVNAG